MSDLLTDAQRAALAHVLDHIIPGEGDMPAGQIAAGYVESAATASAAAARTVLDALAATDAAAGSQHGKPFCDIADSQKEALLKVVEAQDPQVFDDFVSLVYRGYYTNASVIERLGPDAGTPQPKGFPIAPFDPAIVGKVRGLGPHYRAT